MISRLSCKPDRSIAEFIQSLHDNNIVALFDGSTQTYNLTTLIQRLYATSPVQLFDYEFEATRALSEASSGSPPMHPTIPINEQQLRILSKLRLRHLSILIDDHAHWTSVYILYNRFLEFIGLNRIERVVFSEYPHTIYDYLFSLACINSDVSCYAVQFVGQLGRGYSYTIDMNSHSILPSPGHIGRPANGFLHFLDTHKAALVNYSTAIQSLYSYSRDLTKRESKQLALEGHHGFTLWSQKQANALQTYTKFAEKGASIPSEAYGVFYLQVEPESTVTPLSGFFSDQAVAVSDFYEICIQRGLIPCVKEHPHQYQGLYPFSSNCHWQAHPTITAAKSSEFYIRLKEGLPLLNFLPIELSPTQLLKDRNYMLTGTLNGTVGLQTIFSGKQVIEYGLSWYQCHPLVDSRRHNIKTGKNYTDACSENTVLNTAALDNDSNILLFISTIIELVNSLSPPG